MAIIEFPSFGERFITKMILSNKEGRKNAQVLP